MLQKRGEHREPAQSTKSSKHDTYLHQLCITLFKRYCNVWLNDFRLTHDLSPLPSGSVARAIKNIDKVGGFTYNPRTNRLPSKGVAVALAGHSAVYEVADWHSGYESGIVTYIVRVGPLLAGNGRVELGGWYDRVHRKVYLDLVEVYIDRTSAIAAGRARNELAVFDLSAQTEIRLVPGSTGGTRPPIQYFVRNSHRRPRITSTCCWEPEPLPAAAPTSAPKAPQLPQSIAVEQALLPVARPLARRVSAAFSCDFPQPRKPVEH